MPNPTVEKLREGARMAKENNVDLILAVGGGSTIDYAKGVSCSAWCEEDPWQKYYVRQEEATCRIVPVGAVLTMVGTGSEMNGGSVITNHEAGMKIGKVFGPYAYPKFTILNPRFTFTVPQYQMVAGFFDIMSHIMEQYFSGEDDNTSDYLAEGLMRSLVNSSRIAVKNPQDYEARSNIMWTATWALNTLLKCAKSQDWEVHMIGQAIGAHTNATHGMTLAAVSMAYYRHILPFGVRKFARKRVGHQPRRKDRRAVGTGRPAGPGRLDVRDWRGDERQRTGCRQRHAGQDCRQHLPADGRLQDADPRRGGGDPEGKSISMGATTLAT